MPGDKSISHRALIFGALSTGETRISGLLEGEDVLCTVNAMRAMGAMVERHEPGTWRVTGVGVGDLQQPSCELDMGNSGTAARLLMGLVSSHSIRCTFVGDESLSARPMNRVLDPARQVGAIVEASEGGRLPLTITGTEHPSPLDYQTPVASAQIKSAVLLAGLNTPGKTRVRESRATRDHTERMLSAFGANLTVTEDDNARIIELSGKATLSGQLVDVPGDPSSATFPILAAVLCTDSEVTIEGVGINPLRDGFFHAMRAMGADITFENQRTISGEPVADITARHSALTAAPLDPAIIPNMIDEFPAFFVACACATGTSRLTGLEELRVKESDRIHVMADGLAACGVDLRELDDGIEIVGTGTPPSGGATVATHLDHRIAMAFLMLGLVTENPVTIDNSAPINTSFPGFTDLMQGLGARFAEPGESP